jgi:hypothetical protein
MLTQISAACNPTDSRRVRGSVVLAGCHLPSKTGSWIAVRLLHCIFRQLGEQAADASRHQAEAGGAKRLAAASEQAVRAERQAADTLRQQLQEAAASLGRLQDIEVTALQG